MQCLFCGDDNIPGVDLCAGCGADLAGLDLPDADDGTTGQLFSGTIRRLDLEPPLTVQPDTSITEVVETMRNAHHGSVVVCDGKTLVGIFTERDVLTRAVGRECDPDTTRVGSLMSSDPLTLTSDDPIAYAIHRMVVQGWRHIPIVDAGRVVGILSVRNVLRHLFRAL